MKSFKSLFFTNEDPNFMGVSHKWSCESQSVVKTQRWLLMTLQIWVCQTNALSQVNRWDTYSQEGREWLKRKSNILQRKVHGTMQSGLFSNRHTVILKLAGELFLGVSCRRCQEWRAEAPLTHACSSTKSGCQQLHAAAPHQFRVAYVRFFMIWHPSSVLPYEHYSYQLCQ